MLGLKLIHVSKMGHWTRDAMECGWIALHGRKHHCYLVYWYFWLTHWGRVTHICVGRVTIIGWNNGLSPGRRQAIIWTNAGILLIESLGTNFSEILNAIKTFSFKKMALKMSFAKWRRFCFGLNELNASPHRNLNKMSHITQVMLSNIFHWNKINILVNGIHL